MKVAHFSKLNAISPSDVTPTHVPGSSRVCKIALGRVSYHLSVESTLKLSDKLSTRFLHGWSATSLSFFCIQTIVCFYILIQKSSKTCMYKSWSSHLVRLLFRMCTDELTCSTDNICRMQDCSPSRSSFVWLGSFWRRVAVSAIGGRREGFEFSWKWSFLSSIGSTWFVADWRLYTLGTFLSVESKIDVLSSVVYVIKVCLIEIQVQQFQHTNILLCDLDTPKHPKQALLRPLI